MAAMTCRTCGRNAEVAAKEDVVEGGRVVGVRFTMTFPCGHVQDKYRVRKYPDGRRNTQRF